MKKRFFSALICVVLSVTVLSGTAWANGLALISIAGQPIANDTYWKNNADNSGVEQTEDAGSANAYFKKDTEEHGTLYINNLNISNSEAELLGTVYAIESRVSLTLDMTGNNTISTADNNENTSAALIVGGDLTVTGDGSLTATSGAVEDDSSIGVYVNGDLTVESGTLIGSGGEAKKSADAGEEVITESVGVMVNGVVEVNGGKLEGNGDTSEGDAYSSVSTGIDAGAIEMSGGTVIGKGGETTGTSGESCGISVLGGDSADATITAGTGTLTGIGGSAVMRSTGIKANGNVTASGSSEIRGTGGNDGEMSYGIATQSTVQASDSASISGVGGSTDAYSTGLFSKGGISAEDSSEIRGTGGSAAQSSVGIDYDGAMRAEDSSEIRGTGGSATGKGGFSCGINSQGSMTVSDSAAIDAVGGSAGFESVGIFAKGQVKLRVRYDGGDNASVTVSGGRLTATGGKAGIISYGVCAGENAVNYTDGFIISKTTGESENTIAFYTDALTLPESFYWRTSPAAAFSHFPEDGFTDEDTVYYLELRMELPPAAEALVFAVEKTHEGFFVKADFSAFYGVWVDGEAVEGENYTAESKDGGTLVTFTEDYLKTLSKGEHTLRINFTNGYAEMKFTVE